MSDTEHNKGKLIPCHPDESLEDACRMVLQALYENIKTHDGYESWAEYVSEECYRTHYVRGSEVYIVESKALDPDDDIFKAHKGDGGVIHYETKFHNGGCSFNEALDEAFEKLEATQ